MALGRTNIIDVNLICNFENKNLKEKGNAISPVLLTTDQVQSG